jgi:molybdenum cofactor cytidylyltransferase
VIAAGDEAPTLYAIVLAAGASRRFGSPKQLVRVDGRPLMHTVVSRAIEIAGHSTIVINRDWSEGVASSIRAGIVRLPGFCTGAMLMLADQAAVTAEDLRRLAGTWRRQPDYMVAAQYGTTLGAPAIFPSSSFRDLTELRGERGASVLFHRNPDRVVRVPMESAGLDIDTPEDLLRLEPENR